MLGEMPPTYVSIVLHGEPPNSSHQGGFVPRWCCSQCEFWVRHLVVTMADVLHEVDVHTKTRVCSPRMGPGTFTDGERQQASLESGISYTLVCLH